MADIADIAFQLSALREVLSHAGIDIAEVRLAKPQDGVEFMSLMHNGGALLKVETNLAMNNAQLGGVLITWPVTVRGKHAD